MVVSQSLGSIIKMLNPLNSRETRRISKIKRVSCSTNACTQRQSHSYRNTMRQQKLLTQVMTCCPPLLYLDHIFMYFYFLGSPTGDSQNGASGVNFTEHDFLSDRGCSQPIFHGCSKQESSERGSGDRCSLEDRD